MSVPWPESTYADWFAKPERPLACFDRLPTKPAGELVAGDRTWFSHGHRPTYRTVSEVVRCANGIVRVFHRETWREFYDEFAQDFPVEIWRPMSCPVCEAWAAE